MEDLAAVHAVDLTGVAWHKSSYTAGNGNCVEVADVPGFPATAVRDSKNPELPAARVSTAAWATFVTAVATGTLTA
ncbi:DUF397 domain-containing protein [Streptomyces sp. RTd22]|nr:DUF397 domain-containing protein [Streptomyces sp. RTd22]